MASAGGNPRFGLIFATASEAGPLRACLSRSAAALNLSPVPPPTVPPSHSPTLSLSHSPPSSSVLRPPSSVLSVSGIGPAAARKAALEMVETDGVDWLLSVGVAGGLREDLEIGAVVEAAEILDETGRRWISLPLPGSRPTGKSSRAVVYSSPVILRTPQEKRTARDRHQADVVEMEAAAIAAVAAEKGVRFSCVKSISDTFAETLPLDFSQFLAPDGSLRLPAIVIHTLSHPWLIPGLIRLGSNSRIASHRLAEHLLAGLTGVAAGGAEVVVGNAITAESRGSIGDYERPL